MYRHLDAGWVLRLADGAHIPPDPSNRDRTEYLEWVAAGGTAAPYVAPVPTSVTRKQFNKALRKSRLRSELEAAATSDPDTKDWYVDSYIFERSNPDLAKVTAVLGKSENDIDNLFRLAATL